MHIKITDEVISNELGIKQGIKGGVHSIYLYLGIALLFSLLFLVKETSAVIIAISLIGLTVFGFILSLVQISKYSKLKKMVYQHKYTIIKEKVIDRKYNEDDDEINSIEDIDIGLHSLILQDEQGNVRNVFEAYSKYLEDAKIGDEFYFIFLYGNEDRNFPNIIFPADNFYL